MRISAEISIESAAALTRLRFERGNGVQVVTVSKAIDFVLAEWGRNNPEIGKPPRLPPVSAAIGEEL